jgi:hypothetical protein
VAHTVEWFKQRYGIELNGWEEGFINACAGNCEAEGDRARFDEKKKAYAAAIEQWGGAKALKLFNPVYKLPGGRAEIHGPRRKPSQFRHGDRQRPDRLRNSTRSSNGMMFPVRLLESRLAS